MLRVASPARLSPSTCTAIRRRQRERGSWMRHRRRTCPWLHWCATVVQAHSYTKLLASPTFAVRSTPLHLPEVCLAYTGEDVRLTIIKKRKLQKHETLILIKILLRRTRCCSVQPISLPHRDARFLLTADKQVCFS